MIRDIDFGPDTAESSYFGDTDGPYHLEDTDGPDLFEDADDAAKQPKDRPPTKSEMDEFYAKLYLANPKAVIFSVLPPYSDTFRTKA